ncbi:MAG: hypothetical protein K2L12_03625 [Clostridia bacterium]|nr:hypothetical protein [Clostridia bacterium]
MKALNEAVSDKIMECLNNCRTVNIRIPANESFAGYPFLPKYKLYCYNEKQKKLYATSPKIAPILKILAWLITVVMFIIDCIVLLPISLNTVASLSFELIENGLSFFNKDKTYDIEFLDALSKYFRFKRKPYKKFKKLKKVFYIYFENEPLKETYNSILLLCELINTKRIADSAVVIVSKTTLNEPSQCILRLENNEEDNSFIYDFNSDILGYIRNEQYENATDAIRKMLNDKGINNLVEFEFVMQCLAFCYKNLGVNEFKRQFSDFNIAVDYHINAAKRNKFVKSSGLDANFLNFCYNCLLTYYHNRSAISNDNFDTVFINIVKKIKDALISKNEYFSAARLFAKFASAEDAADNYIIAFLHNEFIKSTVNDECYNIINSYVSTSPRAKLFINLYKLNEEEVPDANKVEAIVNHICENKELIPVLRLCFYYYAVNSIYKSDRCSDKFLKAYRTAYDEIDSSESLKCIFGAQFLLLYTTVEDETLHSKYAKTVSQMLNFVLEKSEFLSDKKTYLKICRSLNGLRLDCFSDNLNKMTAMENEAKRYVKEQIYYYINLGATYAFRSNSASDDYKSAISSYNKIKRLVNKNVPLCVKASYFNNLTVFEYLNAPSKETAKKAYIKLNNYVTAQYGSSVITEERRHLAINILIFAILGDSPEQTITNLFDNTATIIESDNYFKFYFHQVKYLYAALHGKSIQIDKTQDSVFFTNKKSFFEQKYEVMNNVALNGGATLSELNCILKEKLSLFKKDYEYFKRPDLFSLVERWYE